MSQFRSPVLTSSPQFLPHKSYQTYRPTVRASCAILYDVLNANHRRLELAKSFASRIELAVEEDGPWIDAKSIVKVMAAKAPANRLLHLRASGADASEAVAALADLVRRDFDEGAGDVAHG
ncbi:MAG TPA: HPr family phosphocarrier protein [Aestuariivirgaceae bacterium]|nr:HPr family phosphocarrier protein [Aestuariivirgaceae bacterium]